MKVINTFYGVVVSLLVVTLQQTNCMSQVDRAIILSSYTATPEQGQLLVKAAAQAQETIDKAMLTAIMAQSSFLAKQITAQEYDTTIIEQSSVIAKTEYDLKNFVQATIASKEVKDLKLPDQTADILSRQKQIIKDNYELALLDEDLSADQKALLKERYENVVAQIEGTTHPWRKTIIGVLAATGIIAGLVLIKSWFTSEN